MREIWIPFNLWSKKRLREDRKTSTSRTKEYGSIDDFFYVEGAKYVIEDVKFLLTEVIIKDYYREEGADSPEELRKVLIGIFRGKPLPEKMYIHFFRKQLSSP